MDLTEAREQIAERIADLEAELRRFRAADEALADLQLPDMPEGGRRRPKREVTKERKEDYKAETDRLNRHRAGETERRVREFLKISKRVVGLNKVAEGAGVPKGSISAVVVKMEREGLLRIDRQGPTQPVIVNYVGKEDSRNGAVSAQEATV